MKKFLVVVMSVVFAAGLAFAADKASTGTDMAKKDNMTATDNSSKASTGGMMSDNATAPKK